jgi:hypothetical protein
MKKEKNEHIWRGIDLEALRQLMDKPSDDAVTAIYQSGSIAKLAELLKGMAKNDSHLSDETPLILKEFVEGELSRSFSDEDIEMFKKTHDIWVKHGMKFVFLLFFRALPYTYMAEKPANVLRITKLLETHTERRIIETAQFVFDVMDKNWWDPNHRGILTALKVRIMHSAMRHIILASEMRGEKWNDDWGKPISQEDLIATNQVFSLEFFKGMKMLGQELSVDEQAAWFHTWKTIGKIMGVEDQLICDSVADAWDLQHCVYDHLFNDETHSGIGLAKALVETMHHFHMPERLTLLLMKTMLADEQFPDCFERMLGPSYSEKYPEYFVRHKSDEDEAAHHETVLKPHFHIEVKGYFQTLKDKKAEINTKKTPTDWFSKLIAAITKFFKGASNEIHLIDIQLGKIHDILHHKDTGHPVEKLEEDTILSLISHLGGIMVAILSSHFRSGKNSGFRIPESLKDHWSLKG